MKNYRIIFVIFLTTCFASGCSTFGKTDLELPYSFEERGISFELSQEDMDSPELFAKNLCVVTDESQYEDSAVTSEAGLVFDITDQSVIYSKNAFAKMNPASTTKILTALVALKYGKLTDQVTVPPEAVITEAGATLCNVHPGDVLTLEQLLYGLMLPSGNDAGVAIAVHLGGSVEGFSELMNAEAKSLGATGTHFTNPHGLTDEAHYTTAYDLYLIFHEALNYPEFRKIIQSTAYTATYTDSTGASVTQTWSGGNWYMGGVRETPDGVTVIGGKTGTTSAAGYCLVMASADEAARSDGTKHEYISIVLKAGSRPGLYDNMTAIVNKIDHN